MQDTKCIISNYWFTGYMDKGCADFFAIDTTWPFNFRMEEKYTNSIILPMWENDLRNQIKRDSLVDFHLYLLLGLVFEGPYIVCKLFQYFLDMLNVQHRLSSLPQTEVCIRLQCLKTSNPLEEVNWEKSLQVSY